MDGGITVIEAKLIIDEAYGELITDDSTRALEIEKALRAEEMLIHASQYLSEQIPQMYRDLW